MNRYEDMLDRSAKHERRKIDFLIAALVVASVILGFTMGFAYKADAAVNFTKADCQYHTTLNQYAVKGQDFQPILPPVMFFEEFHCRQGGIKFEVQVADNKMERQHLREWFGAVNWRQYPDTALLCKKGSELQHIALGFNSSSKVNRRDRAGWPAWVKTYTANHKCEVGR